MFVKELVIGEHYWIVMDTQLAEVELVSHTGHDRPRNCVIKAVDPKVTYEKVCCSGGDLHKDPNAALCQALERQNSKLQDLEEEIDDLIYKLRRIRESQSDLLDLLETHGQQQEAT